MEDRVAFGSEMIDRITECLQDAQCANLLRVQLDKSAMLDSLPAKKIEQYREVFSKRVRISPPSAEQKISAESLRLPSVDSRFVGLIPASCPNPSAFAAASLSVPTPQSIAEGVSLGGARLGSPLNSGQQLSGDGIRPDSRFIGLIPASCPNPSAFAAASLSVPTPQSIAEGASFGGARLGESPLGSGQQIAEGSFAAEATRRLQGLALAPASPASSSAPISEARPALILSAPPLPAPPPAFMTPPPPPLPAPKPQPSAVDIGAFLRSAMGGPQFGFSMGFRF